MGKKYFIYEIKKWVREPIMSFLIAYPVILAIIARFALPFAEEQFHFSLAPYYHIVIAAIMLLTAAVTGGLIGFSILNDRDDKILYAIDVSPVSFNVFMGFRFAMSFILTYISSIAAILIANLVEVPLYALLLVPIAVSLFSSVSAMFINFFASNKVEGFAMMKAGAMIIIFPIVSLFFTDFKEFFFAFEPNFWAVKALGTAMIPKAEFNLGFWGYYPVGIIYVVVLNVLAYKIFRKRIIT
jgi:fluoroquinolone transport system permease protein